MIDTISNEYWINSISETPDGFECPRCNNVWEHRSEAIECITMHSRYVYAVECRDVVKNCSMCLSRMRADRDDDNPLCDECAPYAIDAESN